jgi:hypothetical protein
VEDGGFHVLLPEASRALDEAQVWARPCLAAARAAGALPLLCTGDAAAPLIAQLARGGQGAEASDLIAVSGVPGAVPGSVALMAAAAGADQILTGAAIDALMPRYMRGSYARRAGARRGN